MTTNQPNRRIVQILMSPEKSAFAVDQNTLCKWSTFTLSQRMKLLDIRFPQDHATRMAALREVYENHCIRLRSTQLTLNSTPTQQAKIEKERLVRFQELLSATDLKSIILFLDECMFTSRSLLEKTWRKPAMEELFQKNRLSFDAIGVLGIINLDGEIVVSIVKDGSITLSDLIEASDIIKMKYKRRKVTIFLDNLRLHYNKEFQNTCHSNGQRLIYNACYSSQFNPIERLWALSKKSFGRSVIADCDLKNQAEVRAFVQKTLIEVPALSLRKHVIRCYQRIVAEQQRLAFKSSQRMVDAEMNDPRGAKSAKGKSAERTPQKQAPANPLNYNHQSISSGFNPNDPIMSKHIANLDRIAKGSKAKEEVKGDPVRVPVSIKDLVDATSSKSSLYRSLSYYGQLFLPPKRQCTVQFLRDILIGRKNYFLNKDVPYVCIENMEGLTIKNVLDKVYHVDHVRQYLPDYEVKPEKFISRDYLFAIVNAIDPTFFPRASNEVAARRVVKPKDDGKLENLEVRPELMKVLMDAKSAISVKSNLGTMRSLASNLASTKKRKRREFEKEASGLLTEVQVKRVRF